MDTFLERLDQIKEACNYGLYYPALALSLTIPDICGKIEYQEGNDKEKYEKWYAEHCLGVVIDDKKKYRYERPNDGCLCARDCYALRCSFIHSGKINLKSKDGKKSVDVLFFNLTVSNGEVIEIAWKKLEDSTWGDLKNSIWGDLWKEGLSINVKSFCMKMASAAREYYDSKPDKTVFDDENIQILSITK